MLVFIPHRRPKKPIGPPLGAAHNLSARATMLYAGDRCDHMPRAHPLHPIAQPHSEKTDDHDRHTYEKQKKTTNTYNAFAAHYRHEKPQTARSVAAAARSLQRRPNAWHTLVYIVFWVYVFVYICLYHLRTHTWHELTRRSRARAICSRRPDAHIYARSSSQRPISRAQTPFEGPTTTTTTTPIGLLLRWSGLQTAIAHHHTYYTYTYTSRYTCYWFLFGLRLFCKSLYLEWFSKV